MSASSVFDCYNDAGAWNDEVLPESDVYFSAEWLQLHCPESTSVRGVMFRYQEDDSSWWYPFLLRPLPTEFGLNGYDIESAYGYGGPSTNDRSRAFLRNASRAFDDWCRATDVIAEFSTFHPLLGNHELMEGRMEVMLDRMTVSMDLESEPQSNYSSQARYMCRRAVRGGVTIDMMNPERDIGQFGDFYNEAMSHMNASEFYRFDGEYFEKLARMTSENGMLLFARKDGALAAAAIFLNGESFLHYHLSANNFTIKAPGAMNLLLDKAAEIGRGRGLRRFHLGGGRSPAPDDSLLGFKKTMGRSETHFYIGKKVHNQGKYDALVSLWSERNPELAASCGKRLLCYRSQR